MFWQHDRLWEKNEGWEPLHYAHKVSEQNHDRFKRHKAEFDTFKGNKTFDLHDITFWGLCRGENFQVLPSFLALCSKMIITLDDRQAFYFRILKKRRNFSVITNPKSVTTHGLSVHSRWRSCH